MSTTYSKVGYYDPDATNNYYNIYTSNASIGQLRDDSISLPTNALIISSPFNNTYQRDTMTPAIGMTDGSGILLPLTYSFNKNDFGIDEASNTVYINASQNYDIILQQIKKLESTTKELTNYNTILNSLIKSRATCILDEDYCLVSYIDTTYYTLGLERLFIQELDTTKCKNITTPAYIDSPNQDICISYNISEDTWNNITKDSNQTSAKKMCYFISNYSYIMFVRSKGAITSPLYFTNSKVRTYFTTTNIIYNNKIVGTYTYCNPIALGNYFSFNNEISIDCCIDKIPGYNTSNVVTRTITIDNSDNTQPTAEPSSEVSET